MYRKALVADKIAYFDTATTVLMVLAASAAAFAYPCIERDCN
jgi:hypothetical protein